MKKILSILFIISACSAHAADTSYPINDFKRQTIRQLKIYDNGDSTFSQAVRPSPASKIMLWDGTTTAPVDQEVPALVQITEEHHQAHSGAMYRANVTFEDLGNGTTGYALIRTTTASDAHVHISYNVGGNFMITFSSAPTITSTSTVKIANLNQEDYWNTISATKIYKATASALGGNILDPIFIEGGSGPQSAGSSGASAVEWILNGGHDYLLSCRNISGNSKTISVILQWYEILK